MHWLDDVLEHLVELFPVGEDLVHVKGWVRLPDLAKVLECFEEVHGEWVVGSLLVVVDPALDHSHEIVHDHQFQVLGLVDDEVLLLGLVLCQVVVDPHLA